MDIHISLPAQTLELFEGGLLLRRYSVSTAKNGAGEQNGSFCTPRGKHLIRAKIGGNAPENTVFVKRRPTGEIWSAELAEQFPGRDWMLTRILWLSGLEPGRNRLGKVDTMRRYIYLHGSPDTARMGEPGSIGCVRMHNREIMELFDLAPPYTRVNICDYRIETGSWSAMMTRAHPVRTKVFVEEQGVPQALEWDEFDAVSRHALALDAGGNVIGAGRLLPDGHIGRMAVLPEWRARGVGAALLRRLMEEAGESGQRRLLLNSQIQAAPFYARFGFIPEGREFIEAGIPHITMAQSL
ncbi:MAG: GNAT family N-acetyltransferase [Betaproteobacteria bacterium]|nr:GNAT family N-acetyltransferase [Betaproteobacteria bacterium]